MAANCAIDGKKIGALTGKVKLNDGEWICIDHWKQLGFNRTSDVSYAANLNSEDAKHYISNSVSAKAILSADRQALKQSEKNIANSHVESSNQRLDEIKQQFENAGVINLFGTKKEVNALPEILNSDEIVKFAASGYVTGGTALIVVTDKRLLFINKGMLYGTDFTDIPLDKINALSYSTKMLLATVSFMNGATAVKIDNVDKHVAPKLINQIKESITNINQASISSPVEKDLISQLRDLKSLVDDGILTQEEFNSQKEKLLNK